MLPALLPVWLWQAFITAIAYPLSLTRLDEERRKNVYFGIPAVAAMLIAVTSVIFTMTSTKIIDERYRSFMQRSIMMEDYKTAVILGGRLVSNRNNVDAPTRFEYAIALAKNGEFARSEAILADLAPSDKPGYPVAHFRKAQLLAKEVAKSSNAKNLAELRWHLENTEDEKSEELLRLWAVYYVTVGQPDEAIKPLEKASQVNPRLHFGLASLYNEVGNKQGESRHLRLAETTLRQILKEDPLSINDRATYSQVLIKLNRQEEAEALILKGVQIDNSAEMRRHAAKFYISLFQVCRRDHPNDLMTQFQFLEKSLRYDLGIQEVYQYLIDLYAIIDYESEDGEEDGEEAKAIRNKLNEILIEGKAPALAHFALSGIAKMDGNNEEAFQHLKQAYKQNPNIPAVLNNLAWMYANQEKPELSRALELAKSAIKYFPNDPIFHDTIAMIYMKQEKYEDALAEYEAIVGVSRNKLEVYSNLAKIYSKLGMRIQANSYAEKAQEEQRRELDEKKDFRR
jgi:tetratricopeptide (TPR) repeat protein